MSNKPVEPIIPGLDPLYDKGEDSLVEWLNSGVKYALRVRDGFEDMVITGLMFLRQKQWASIRRTAQGVLQRRVEIAPELEKMLVIDDNVGPIFRSVFTGICRDVPDFVAYPATSDPNDVQAARLATAFLKSRDRADKEDEIRQNDVMWAAATSECLRFTYWNAELGREIGIGQKEGDIDTETVNWFRYLKDPQNTEGEWPPRFLVHYDARDVDEIKAIFGKDVAPEDVADKVRSLDRLATAVAYEREHPRESTKHSAVVWRMCIPPCAGYPEGQWFIWAGKTFLKKMPLLKGIFPYTRFDWFPQPGRLYGASLPELLIDRQKLLNILASQLTEVMHRQLRMDMLVSGYQLPEYHTLEDGKRVYFHDNESGEGTFQLLDYANINLPAAMEIQRDHRQMMQKVGGARDPSLGEIARVDVKATEVKMASDADVSLITWYADRMAKRWADVGKIKLQLAQQMYDNFRVLDYTGQKLAKDIDSFTGADLAGANDVVPVPVPHLTERDKQQLFIVAMNNGWLGPYTDPEAEVIARMFLQGAGANDIEEQIERIYGPVDELYDTVKQMRNMRYELILRKMQMELNPPPIAAPGQNSSPEQNLSNLPAQPPEELVAQAIREELGG